MAIKLDVKDYCHECMSFEADIEDTREIRYFSSEYAFDKSAKPIRMGEVTIRCAHREKCANIQKYLKDNMIRG